jgi:retron-type reverse transcriptase
MFEFKEIYTAYLKCRKLKRSTTNALKFEQNLIENLCNLETSLNNKTYTFKRSVCFLTSSLKLREVFASDFQDRVVHHIVVPILEQICEPFFINDSYSNRKGKGIHQASKRALHFSKGSRYFLQLDIKNFFYTIDKDILLNKLNNIITRNYNKVNKTKITLSEILYLCKKIVYQDISKNVFVKGDKKSFENIPNHKTLFKTHKNKALPIRNLTSQFFANLYLNDFDNYIKRQLKTKRYLRYVDDFVLFGNSKQELLYKYEKIIIYLQENLQLKLRDRYILKDNNQGLYFLGYIIRPNYVLTRKRVINNFKYKKTKFLDKYEKSKANMSLEEIRNFLSVQASFKGHISHSNSYRLNLKTGVINDEKHIKLISTNWNTI